MPPLGKYAYAIPSAHSPRLSRWATLAFAPPLVVGLSLSFIAVFASHEHTLRAILSILPAQLFIFPFAFAYCVLPATLLWWLFESKTIRHPIAKSRKAFTFSGAGCGLLLAPTTLQWVFNLSTKSTELERYFLIIGPLAGAITAWLVFPKYNEPAP